MKKTLGGWIALMVVALVLIPWHQQEAGFFTGRWISADWGEKKDAASALFLLASDAGYGFVARLGDLQTKNRAGKVDKEALRNK